MNSDLIQRLRDADIHSIQRINGSRIFGEAADALTAAQEENERLVHDIERLSASLSAEVMGSERLREALRFYADTSKYPAPLTGGQGELYYDCGQIARAALDGLPR